jgi:hypothetical protein
MTGAASAEAAPPGPAPRGAPPARGRRLGRGLLAAAGLTALVLVYVHLGRPLLTAAGIYLRLPEDTLTVLKGLLAVTALGLVGWEAARRLRRRPLPRRGVAVVGGALGVLATMGFLNSDDLAYGRYYHLWEFFHYYLGSKYQAELGYKRIYACTAVAEAELGPVLEGEVRRRQLRDLATDTLVPAASALADPAACTSHFTAARWAEFRRDVRWFRSQASFSHWSLIQIDHGYNPPPLWTATGHVVASLVPPSATGMKALASIDLVLLGLLFGFVWWGFGWRVLCLALVFFGTQFPANGLFTAGALLRQDWLLLTVASVGLAHRGRSAWAGAALAGAALLRLFPGLLFAGPAVVAVAHLVRRRRLAAAHARFFAGAAVAGLALVALSVAATSASAWPRFAEHIRLHSAVPLTNNMGLRVLVARLTRREPPRQGPLKAPAFRLESLPTAALAQPGLPEQNEPASAPAAASEPLRLKLPDLAARAANSPAPVTRFSSGAGRALFFALAALLAAGFGVVAWRERRLWIAEALGIVLVAGLVEITCYYYSLFLVAALLARATRWLERAVLGAAAASALLVAWPRIAAAWPDRYAAESAVFVALSLLLLVGVARRTRPAK